MVQQELCKREQAYMMLDQLFSIIMPLGRIKKLFVDNEAAKSHGHL